MTAKYSASLTALKGAEQAVQEEEAHHATESQDHAADSGATSDSQEGGESVLTQ